VAEQPLRAGYDVCRLTYLLADLPVQLLGRLRSDRVLCSPAPTREDGIVGRPLRHGAAFALADPDAQPTAEMTTTTETTRYGTATARAWDRLHPRLTRRGTWTEHTGVLPIIEGTLIRLQVDHLPGQRDPKPLWLWWSRTDPTEPEVDRCWQAFLRRFDLEHTFRLCKQTLGWTRPKIRDPAAGDRWTWLIITAHTQLRLARGLTNDLRRPWERPAQPTASPPPGSVGGFATSARRPRCRPAHRNPPTRAPADHPAPATATAPHTSESAKPSNQTQRRRLRTATPVKRQAESARVPPEALDEAGLVRELDPRVAAGRAARRHHPAA